MLLAFTQVCRPMREKFVPWLWEHRNYLCGRSNALDDHLWAWDMFRKQSRVLIATPSLAAWVRYARFPPTFYWPLSYSYLSSGFPRTFSVRMTYGSEIAGLLPLLPNLETLEVLAKDSPGLTTEQSFKSIKLPQVRTLITNSYTHYLMKCCSNSTKVVIYTWDDIYSTYLRSLSFVADALVCLALCLPKSEQIQGAGVFSFSVGICSEVDQQKRPYYALTSRNYASSRSVDSSVL